MFAKIWTTQILLRINLRNRNLKIVFADSVKFKLTYIVLLENKKNPADIQIVFLEVYYFVASERNHLFSLLVNLLVSIFKNHIKLIK